MDPWVYGFYELYETCPDHFFVYKDTNNKRQFRAFKSHIEYYEYLKTIKLEERNHFETIKGDKIQKPHFDIDINKENIGVIITELDIINDLIFAILNYSKLLGYDIKTEDILMYQSHGKDKYSYHIIIDNWYHINNKEAKLFYQGVISNMQHTKSIFVDSSVYKSLQQFRIIGNCKYGTGRYKARVYSHQFYNTLLKWNQVDPIKEFEQSLITICSGTPKHLLIPEPLGNDNKLNIKFEQISSDILPEISIPNCYELSKETSYGIRLQRKKDIYGKNISAKCMVCKDYNGNYIIHDNDNAFVTKVNNEIYFHCFRKPALKKLLYVIQTPSKYKLALEASNYRNQKNEDSFDIYDLLKNRYPEISHKDL